MRRLLQATRRFIGRRAAMACALPLLAVAAVLVVGLLEATQRPFEREARIGLAHWPANAAPLQIALISDIHIGNRAMDPARLTSIVEQLNAARPDLVVIAGDFVIGYDATGADARAAALTVPLSRLHAPLGVIAVLGNHDHWTAPAAIRAALASAGITVLQNASTRRGPLTILGVDDSFSRHDDVPATIAAAQGLGGVPVVLTHSPDIAGRLDGRWPLLLAGHTHCAQVVLPGMGTLARFMPKLHGQPIYDLRYGCGIVHYPGRTVVITAGLGSGTSPVRIGAPPDWWLLTLGPAP